MGPVPHARLTVTFDTPKPGHVLGFGPEICGKVVVVDLGLEPLRAVVPDVRPGRGYIAPFRLTLSGGGDVPSPGAIHPIWAVPDRRQRCLDDPIRAFQKHEGHKYDHGHVFVFTGPMGHGGAARLAARAALRVGAGAVTLCARPSAVMEHAGRVDAIMLRRVAGPEDLDALLGKGRAASICIGPGFGTGAEEAEMLRAVLERRCPVVIDADGLTLLAADAALRELLHEYCVLTPHLGEFRRLCPDLAADLEGPKLRGRSYPDAVKKMPHRGGTMVDDGQSYRDILDQQRAPLPSKIDVTCAAAKQFGCTVLLKGPDTVIADEIGCAAVNAAVYERAMPWLATAGSGDVLAGLIAGLRARGKIPWTSAKLGAWLHLEAALAFGPGLIADDLPDVLPKMFRDRLR